MWVVGMTGIMRTGSGRRAEHALTLVEMIVVVAICAVVAGLLFPVLLRSRSAARTVVCAQNLHGLGEVFTVSMQETRGTLPDAFYTFNGHDGSYQVAVRTPQGTQPDTLMKGDLKRSLVCPSDDTPITVAGTNMAGTAVPIPVSYAYNVSLPLMFRSLSRLSKPADTVTFYDGDLSVVAGATWQFNQTWAENTIRFRHRGDANFLFADGHVEKTGRYPDISFAGGAQWFASARDTRALAPEPVAAAAPEPPAAVEFSVTGGEVIPNEECSMTVKCIGSDIRTGGTHIPVQAWYSINSGSKNVMTNDTQGGETATVNPFHAGDTVIIGGKCMQYISNAYQSNDGKGHCWVLRNGDTVPSIAGYSGQRSMKDFLASYMDSSGKLTLGINDAIYLFEMSSDIDYTRYSWADFQDLVVLVTLTKQRYSVGGKININPNNSSDNEFTLTLPNGTIVTRDDLKNDAPKSGTGFASGKLEYTGPATIVSVKPKGNGNQNGLTVNGAAYAVANSSRYVISSNTMNVHLYNDNRNSQGKATGKWWIDITATQATIQVMKSSKQSGF